MSFVVPELFEPVKAFATALGIGLLRASSAPAMALPRPASLVVRPHLCQRP